MLYYISWTHSDPVYHQFVPGIGVLVSPPNVNQVWSVGYWPVLPSTLILDSGAYQYQRQHQSPGPEAVLNRQLNMIAGHTVATGICHLDVPLIGTRELAEVERRVVQTLANARWLIDHNEEQPLPEHVHPVGVIQGYSVESVYLAGRTLADMGYTHFALGSLAPLVPHTQDEVLRRVEAALEAVGPHIHVLGVSSVTLLPQISRLGIQSADSAAPIREAWLGGIFYSRPFRRYKLSSPHFNEWRRTYSFAEILAEPHQCECPVCAEDSARILEPRGKRFVNLRAIHNCYHLAREFADTAADAGKA